MQVKLKDVVLSDTALNRLLTESHPKKAKDTFAIAQIAREIAPALDDFAKARSSIMEQYAVQLPDKPDTWQFVLKDEDGEPVVKYDGEDDTEGHTIPNADALRAFSDEVDELLESEVVKITRKISLSQLERLSLDPTLSPSEMSRLWWLIDEFEDGDTP